jgi:preprotein translocase subunit SecA
MQAAQRFFVLTQTDNLWKEHLQAIKFLQQAVSLRGYAQVPRLQTTSVRHFGCTPEHGAFNC